MSYTTIYDISVQGYHEWPLAILALALGVACAGSLVYLRSQHRSLRAFYGLLVFTLFAAAGASMTYWDHARLARSLARGESQVVEGTVSGHWTKVMSGKRDGRRRTSTYEGFQVGEVKFGYYREVGAAGFHNGGSSPVRIHDGMRVRVHYHADAVRERAENRILRLEVGEGSRSPLAGRSGGDLRPGAWRELAEAGRFAEAAPLVEARYAGGSGHEEYTAERAAFYESWAESVRGADREQALRLYREALTSYVLYTSRAINEAERAERLPDVLRVQEKLGRLAAAR